MRFQTRSNVARTRTRARLMLWSAALLVLVPASGLYPVPAALAANSPMISVVAVNSVKPAVKTPTWEGPVSVTVHGTGFDPTKGLAFAVWLERNGDVTLDSTEPRATPSKSTFTGTPGTFDVTFSVSDVPAGAYSIQAGYCEDINSDTCYDVSTATSTTGIASTPVIITFATSPTRFGPGTTVTVTGYGFAAGSVNVVWFDGHNDGVADADDAQMPVTVGASGDFTASLFVVGPCGLGVCDPGQYKILAGSSTKAIAEAPVDVASCFYQSCTTDAGNTVCFLGNSPSDAIHYCAEKNVDVGYTDCHLLTPDHPTCYDFSNTGPSFAGAGVLAAMTNDLGPPGSGCDAIRSAMVSVAATYGYHVGGDTFPGSDDGIPDSGPDATPNGDRNLAGIACNPTCFPDACPGPPFDFYSYLGSEITQGRHIPDDGILAQIVTTLQLGGPLVMAPAQKALALAAVVGAIACGYVWYHCDGRDITANFLAKPNLQTKKIPFPVFQASDPFKPPNPCPASGGTCWGQLIGWGQVTCTSMSPGTCESNLPRDQQPNLPIPGTAGINNVDAPITCATGEVIGLSIGYDGDVGFTVNGPNVLPLLNYHNFQPGPGGSDPPNGIDVEIPLGDPQHPAPTDFANFLGPVTTLRPGMEVKVCGHYVADMHMLWNELHPMTSLTILPVFNVGASSSDVTVQAGETASDTISTALSSGPSAPVTLSVTSSLPGGATARFTPPTVTPTTSTAGTSTLTVDNLPVGDFTLTVQGQSGDVTSTTTVKVHVYDYTVAVSPSDQTVLRGGSTSFLVSMALVPGSSTFGVPAISLGTPGLPPDATASFVSLGVLPTLTPTLAGVSTQLSVQTAGLLGSSLGDFAFAVVGTDAAGSTRSGSANLHIYDFTVTAAPASLQVLTTGSNSYMLTGALASQSSTKGLPPITLSVAGLPANAVPSFSPNNWSPVGFTSTLTITTSNAASSPGLTLTIAGTDIRSPEGGIRSTPVTLVVLTPAQALPLVISHINLLRSAGVLNGGQANSFITKLNLAITALALKPPGKATACNQLAAFVNEVNSYVALNILTPAQANLLLGGPLGINAIRSAIPC